jgi:hypothetical protein
MPRFSPPEPLQLLIGLGNRRWQPLLAAAACVALLSPGATQAREWVVGGSHRPWTEPMGRSIALDDTTEPGAIQPTQLKPGENLMKSAESVAGNLFSIYGYRWASGRGRLYMTAENLQTGWNPRLWSYGSSAAPGRQALIDGIEDIPAIFEQSPSTGRPNADNWETFDLAIPVPIDSVAFFPPQKGLQPVLGQLYRDLFPRGFTVSRTTRTRSWLLEEEEPSDTGRGSSYHPLDEVISQTFGNTRGVVGLRFPLRFTRFLRLYFGGVTQTFAVAEFKAFGRGFPGEGRYLSQPITIADGRPLSFGRITWHTTAYRLDRDGAIVEDPSAPVRLLLRTRAGLDDQPEVYHVFDELGRQQVVDQATYAGAPAARIQFQVGSAGFKGAITDDTENWDPWSSPYERSGEGIRASDARPYLQFRFELQSDDPLAFARLDSIAVEYSPLLAADVLGEVALQGGEAATGPAVIATGIDTVFLYDVKATFDRADQPGFDGLELDVPTATRFLGLEMGTPLAAVAPDSVDSSSVDRLRVYFPSHRITRDRNLPLRVRLRGSIFQASVFFTGQALDTGGANLPQTITPGDANPDVPSNSIQIISMEPRVRVLKAVQLQPRAITPNGDRINDQLRVGFTLIGVEQAAVSLEVLDLAGRLVARLEPGAGTAGHYVQTWDGRSSAGDLVTAGIYLLRVKVDVDRGSSEQLYPVSVVY